MKSSTQQKINSIKQDIITLDNKLQVAQGDYRSFQSASNKLVQDLLESAFADLELPSPFSILCRRRTVELRTHENGYTYTVAELSFNDDFLSGKITPSFRFNGGRDVDVLDTVSAFGKHVKMVDTGLATRLEQIDASELKSFRTLRKNIDALDLERTQLKTKITDLVKTDTMSQLLSVDGYTPLNVKDNTSSNWSRTLASTLYASHGIELRRVTNMRIDSTTASGKTVTLSISDMYGREDLYATRMDKLENFMISEAMLLEKSEQLGYDLVPNVVIK